MKSNSDMLKIIAGILGRAAKDHAQEHDGSVEEACDRAALTIRQHLNMLNAFDHKMPPEAIDEAVAQALGYIREGAGLGKH